MSTLLTTTLNNGLTVLAKLYHGAPTALTYANRTQAERAAEKVGGTVYGRRPFFVVPAKNPLTARQEWARRQLGRVGVADGDTDA